MSALLHLIQRQEWQFFLTCTFKNSRTMGAKARHSMQFELLRYMGSFGAERRRGNALLNNLQFVIREELGEQGNRLHWHALVTGLKPSYVRTSTCLLSIGYWLGMGGGMAKIRVYEDGLDASSYICKGLEELTFEDTTRNGANRYECGKFNGDDTLMLIPSRALLATWRRAAFDSGRLRSALARRRTARSDLFDR